ncbi:MAG: NUDIX hydrolase [Flavobacteriales bacterium]
MAQKYKVFINTSRLILMESQLLEFEPADGFEVQHYQSKNQLLHCIEKMESEEAPLCICMHSEDIAQLWLDFKSFYSVVTAGGGLVENPAGELLFIYRNKKWDLPKGKKEKGESIQGSALREVQEECGLKHLVLGRKLTATWHTFGGIEHRKLKKSVWYHMYSAQEELTPQLEEGITKIKWVPVEGIPKKLKKAYSSISEVIEAYQSISWPTDLPLE